MVLEKTLESPLDSNEIKPIQKEIKSEYSLEGLLLKLKFQYFGHLMQRADSLEKTLMLGGIEGMGSVVAQDEMVKYHHRLNSVQFSRSVVSDSLRP